MIMCQSELYMTNAQKKAPYNALVWFLYLKLCVCIGPCSVFGMLFETRSKEATVPTVQKGTLIKVGCCGAHLSNLIGQFESISDAAMAWYVERVADGRAVSACNHKSIVLLFCLLS